MRGGGGGGGGRGLCEFLMPSMMPINFDLACSLSRTDRKDAFLGPSS